MDRRQFMGAVAAGAALTAVANTSVAGAKEAGNLTSIFEGSFYLTKENPGRWAAKAAGHLPV
ncbi:MAG: twin-arginine translocation signal domain-containing protein, partial [Pseudomonadales bacterium]|nr:twin-arginine translocation signal domain-containing protein [Pseudomonadales bacterium]